MFVTQAETDFAYGNVYIPSREIVPRGRILSPFSPRITNPELRSPLLSIAFPATGKGVLLIGARVLFLVIPLFLLAPCQP